MLNFFSSDESILNSHPSRRHYSLDRRHYTRYTLYTPRKERYTRENRHPHSPRVLGNSAR